MEASIAIGSCIGETIRALTLEVRDQRRSRKTTMKIAIGSNRRDDRQDTGAGIQIEIALSEDQQTANRPRQIDASQNNQFRHSSTISTFSLIMFSN